MKVNTFFHIFLCFFVTLTSYGQSSKIKILEEGIIMGDNGVNTPTPSAVLDVESNMKGVVFPRLTQVQIDQILNPVQGLLLFNIDKRIYQFYNGEEWLELGLSIPILPLASPSGLVAVAVAYDRVSLSWVDESEDEAGFEIYRRTLNGVFALIHTTDQNIEEYIDNNEGIGLESDTEYEYYIRAINAEDESDFTPVAAARTLFYDFGNALSFDDVDDYTQLTNLETTALPANMTVFWWAKRNVTAQNCRVFQFKSGSGFIFFKYNKVGGTPHVGISVRSKTGSGNFNHTMVFGEANERHLITCHVEYLSSTSMRLKVSINGSPYYSKDISGGTFISPDTIENNAFVVINAETLNGELAELTVLNRALSDLELAELYNSGNGRDITKLVDPSNLFARWKFEETAGNVTTEEINGWDLILNNFTSVDADKWVEF